MDLRAIALGGFLAGSTLALASDGYLGGGDEALARAIAAGRRSRAEPETVLERETPPVAVLDIEADDEEALIFMLTAWLAAEGAT